jgi:hypothetical protein
MAQDPSWLPKSMKLEMDEMWSFVGSKKQQLFINRYEFGRTV